MEVTFLIKFTNTVSYQFVFFQIVVLESGLAYQPGEFVANLIFQGVHDDDICNFTGIVNQGL